VTLEGGLTEIVWWCTCCEELELQQAMFSGLYAVLAGPEFVAGQAPQCSHLRILLSIGEGLGKSASDLCHQRFTGDRKLPLEMGLGEDLEGNEGPQDVEEEHVCQLKVVFNGMLGGAILVGDASCRFGVVLETTRGSWACSECSSKGCWHLRSVTGVAVDGGRSTSGMSLEEFERMLEEKLDKAAGHRRLAGFSHKRIAEAQKPEEALAKVLKERAMLLSGFPSRCPIELDDLLGQCLCCGEAWNKAEQVWVEATIFHLTASIPTLVELRRCACGGRLHYDGAVDGLLNFSDAYLFSYELLNW
jgi:hypothetical protein